MKATVRELNEPARLSNVLYMASNSKFINYTLYFSISSDTCLEKRRVCVYAHMPANSRTRMIDPLWKIIKEYDNFRSERRIFFNFVISSAPAFAHTPPRREYQVARRNIAPTRDRISRTKFAYIASSLHIYI